MCKVCFFLFYLSLIYVNDEQIASPEDDGPIDEAFNLVEKAEPVHTVICLRRRKPSTLNSTVQRGLTFYTMEVVTHI